MLGFFFENTALCNFELNLRETASANHQKPSILVKIRGAERLRFFRSCLITAVTQTICFIKILRIHPPSWPSPEEEGKNTPPSGHFVR